MSNINFGTKFLYFWAILISQMTGKILNFFVYFFVLSDLDGFQDGENVIVLSNFILNSI